MKKGIHPKYEEVNVVMTDGTAFKTPFHPRFQRTAPGRGPENPPGLGWRRGVA